MKQTTGWNWIKWWNAKIVMKRLLTYRQIVGPQFYFRVIHVSNGLQWMNGCEAHSTFNVDAIYSAYRLSHWRYWHRRHDGKLVNYPKVNWIINFQKVINQIQSTSSTKIWECMGNADVIFFIPPNLFFFGESFWWAFEWAETNCWLLIEPWLIDMIFWNWQLMWLIIVLFFQLLMRHELTIRARYATKWASNSQCLIHAGPPWFVISIPKWCSISVKWIICSGVNRNDSNWGGGAYYGIVMNSYLSPCSNLDRILSDFVRNTNSDKFSFESLFEFGQIWAKHCSNLFEFA